MARVGLCLPLLAACTSLLGVDGDFDQQHTDAAVDAASDAADAAADGANDSGDAAATPDGADASGDGPIDATPTESCLNGQDDDGDSLIDCQDPDCTAAGYSCAPAAPAGFSGPYAFYDGPSSPSACPSPYGTEFARGGIGFSAPSASCAPCTCKSPDCRADLTLYSDGACVTTEGWGLSGSGGGCVYYKAKTKYGSIKLTGGTLSCLNGGGSLSKPPTSWSSERTLCTADSTGAGCGASAACVPPVPAPFNPRTCVASATVKSCAAPYSVSFDMLSQVTDTRKCSACSCSSPSCNVDVSYVLEQTYCGGAQPLASGCTPIGTSTTVAYSTKQVGTAACTPSGGVLSGTVSAAGALTVCCLP